MKNLIISIAFILLLNCQYETNNKKISIEKECSIKEISLNNDIKLFILDFIKSVNNANCIYELYIDKKTEEEYFITVFNNPNDLNYFRNHSPLNYTLLNDKLIFIYTGIEDFIDKKFYRPKIDLEKFYMGNKNLNNAISTLSMVIEKDATYIIEDVGLPFSDVKFLVPIHVLKE
jgi:hypothetical protein